MAYNSLYDKSQYYDIVFERDVSQEINFVRQVFAHHMGRPLESVLELACGPGYHTVAFAEAGLRAIGLDLQSEMLNVARDKAGSRGVEASWLEADMTDFSLEEPVDAVVSMFDGITVLPTLDLLIANFQAVARNLKPGGLYILDHMHPRDQSPADYGTLYWSGERDGVFVELIWPVNRPEIDLQTSTITVEVELRVTKNGAQEVYRDTATERVFILPQEFEMLARLSGVFRPLAYYGNFLLDQPLDFSARSTQMIIVLQKTS
ncbi:MAG: class I SAM-dependent methyltransferase [Anaerolineae bacterium]|nr:class I SAM-dependent methyltransferase [Anaerolineae bacterium]